MPATPEHFRHLALDLPDATEGEHMDHPDFRVKGKIFATLWHTGEWGMVKLNPAQQASYIKARPKAFVACKGAWGRGGATQVLLDKVDKPTLKAAIITAWRNTAPKSLVEELGPPPPKAPK